MAMNEKKEEEKEDLGTLADYIRYPEWYSIRVGENLDWCMVTRNEPEPDENTAK